MSAKDEPTHQSDVSGSSNLKGNGKETDPGEPVRDRDRHPRFPQTVSQVPMPPQHQSTVSQVLLPPYEKLANPGPLGLLGFAVTTFVLGLYQCGVGLPHDNPEGNVGPDQAVLGLAIFMGGTAQFIAGIMEWRVGNTFGTTVHCSYGAFWLSYAMFLIPYLDIKGAYNNDAKAYSFAIGVYLIIWCALSFLFLVAALKTNITIIGVFFFLVLAFLFLSIAAFIETEHPVQSVRINKTGGAFTVICAAIAFYAGGSGLMLPDTTMVRFPLGIIPRDVDDSS